MVIVLMIIRDGFILSVGRFLSTVHEKNLYLSIVQHMSFKLLTRFSVTSSFIFIVTFKTFVQLDENYIFRLSSDEKLRTRLPPCPIGSALPPRLVNLARANSFSAASVTHSMLKTQFCTIFSLPILRNAC